MWCRRRESAAGRGALLEQTVERAARWVPSPVRWRGNSLRPQLNSVLWDGASRAGLTVSVRSLGSGQQHVQSPISRSPCEGPRE